jgi:hypothetical protein
MHALVAFRFFEYSFAIVCGGFFLTLSRALSDARDLLIYSRCAI